MRPRWLPAHRAALAAPKDITAVIAFLASDLAQRITGDTLRVNGGSTL